MALFDRRMMQLQAAFFKFLDLGPIRFYRQLYRTIFRANVNRTCLCRERFSSFFAIGIGLEVHVNFSEFEELFPNDMKAKLLSLQPCLASLETTDI